MDTHIRLKHYRKLEQLIIEKLVHSFPRVYIALNPVLFNDLSFLLTNCFFIGCVLISYNPGTFDDYLVSLIVCALSVLNFETVKTIVFSIVEVNRFCWSV